MVFSHIFCLLIPYSAHVGDKCFQIEIIPLFSQRFSMLFASLSDISHPSTPVISASHFLIREFDKQVTGYSGGSGYAN